MFFGRPAGLDIPVAAPAAHGLKTDEVVTDEAALWAVPEADLRVDVLVRQGERVAQGAPVLRLQRAPEIHFVAPMPAEVATIELAPGRRLGTIRFFHEPGAGRERFDTAEAEMRATALRALIQRSGLWTSIRSRPFGRLGEPDEVPAAIVVMAVETRPHGPDPRETLAGREKDLHRGLAALARLAEGPVLLCQDGRADLVSRDIERLQIVKVTAPHPWGLAGLQIHSHAPAAVERPVWDIHAEEVAALGELLRTGLLPQARRVSLSGPALTEARTVLCQPGADLRGLTYGLAAPGPYRLLSGSALDGQEAHWLRPLDRQVTALGPSPRNGKRHWFFRALRGAARPLPLIPSAALDRALGGALPVMPLLRALSAGDSETAVKLGALSLVEEDLALADYVTGADPRLSHLLRAMLDRIAEEEGA